MEHISWKLHNFSDPDSQSYPCKWSQEDTGEFVGALNIKVVKGTKLAIGDMLTSDPYVILTLGEHKVQTLIKKSDLNPVWNEVLKLPVPQNYGPLKLNQGDLTETQNEGAPAPIPQNPKLSKAERHVIQEAQRAAKAAAKEAGLSGKSTTTASGVSPAMPKQPKIVKTSLKKDMQFDDVHWVEKAKRCLVVNQSEARNRVELFRHLPQYVHGTELPDLESKNFQLDPMHPSVYKEIIKYFHANM